MKAILKLTLFSLFAFSVYTYSQTINYRSSQVSTPTNSLPPDPAEKGKETLKGIDSDNDGVRDDVQIAIYNRYPDDGAKRNALTITAIHFQQEIIFGVEGDGNAIFNHAVGVFKPIQCLYEVFDDDDYEEAAFVKVIVLNTPERFKANGRFNEAINGNTFSLRNYDNPCGK